MYVFVPTSPRIYLDVEVARVEEAGADAAVRGTRGVLDNGCTQTDV